MPKGWSRPVANLSIACGFAVGAYAAKDEDGAGAGVSEKEIAVGRCPEQARHRECATTQLHVLLVVSTLHGSSIASGVKRHLEARRSNRPGVIRAWNQMRSIVDSFLGLGLRQVGDRDLATGTRLLLIPIGEGSLTGGDLLCLY